MCWLGLWLGGVVCHTKDYQVLQLVPHPPRHLLIRVKSYLMDTHPIPSTTTHVVAKPPLAAKPLWMQSSHPFPLSHSAGPAGGSQQLLSFHWDRSNPPWPGNLPPLLVCNGWRHQVTVAPIQSNCIVDCVKAHWLLPPPLMRYQPSPPFALLASVKISLVATFVGIVWRRTWMYSASVCMPHSSRTSVVFG